MTDTLAIALAQLNPTVGDLEGNRALILRARAEAAAQGADLVVCTELVVTGYPPEDLVLKPMFQEQTRADRGIARGSDSRWRAGASARSPLGRGRQALQRRSPARGRPGHSAALQVRAPQLRGLRRGAGLRARGPAWTRTVSRRPPRRHGLRGYVVPRGRRMPRGIGCRDHDRDQRLALRERQGRRPSQLRRHPHRRDRAAADLREPGGRAGRARLRRCLLRPQRRQQPLRPGACLRRVTHRHPLVA